MLIKLLDPLIDHFKNTENRSLLARIYGLFTIKSKVFSPVDIILMQNTSRILDRTNSTLAFDLKGSTFKRQSVKTSKLLKDKNLLYLQNIEKLFNIRSEISDLLLSTIKADSDFLSRQNLMDYSLLLVIE